MSIMKKKEGKREKEKKNGCTEAGREKSRSKIGVNGTENVH